MTEQQSGPCLVVTTISEPNSVLRSLQSSASEAGVSFIVIGDSKSPSRFDLGGVEYFSLSEQRALEFAFASACPEETYARKNIGYLLAFMRKCSFVVETDDDNYPTSRDFFRPIPLEAEVEVVTAPGWYNAYSDFSGRKIWPRGFPLERVNDGRPGSRSNRTVFLPIQQGLADGNPDVDAIYRMTCDLPLEFEKREPLALDVGTWCPFNSQNTIFMPPAFRLMYLPRYCTFRMTDIWRSFVAQVVCWANDWLIAFKSPTVQQDRNDHDLLSDFADEVPGFLHNSRIAEILGSLDLVAGESHLAENMRFCYEALVRAGFVGKAELSLLDAWLSDCDALGV